MNDKISLRLNYTFLKAVLYFLFLLGFFLPLKTYVFDLEKYNISFINMNDGSLIFTIVFASLIVLLLISIFFGISIHNFLNILPDLLGMLVMIGTSLYLMYEALISVDPLPKNGSISVNIGVAAPYMIFISIIAVLLYIDGKNLSISFYSEKSDSR